MKHKPPNGVIMPSARLPVMASRYNEPEKSTIPAKNSEAGRVIGVPVARE